MWYKLARDFAKFNQFDNFDQVISEVTDKIYEMILNQKNAYAEFNYYVLNSTSLDMKVYLMLVQDDTFPRWVAEYIYDPRHIIRINYGYFKNKYYTDLDRSKLEAQLKRTVVHELQHAAERNYDIEKDLSEREIKKHEKWKSEFYEQENVPESERPSWDSSLDVHYINTPTEIRANLAEIFSELNLPANKDEVKEKLGAPSYENIYALISDRDKFGRYKFIAPEAKKYMVKELYKAIFN